jgi:pimeloyl-ACP methyl ester carboxylesterase
MNYEIRGAKDGFPIVFGHGWDRDLTDFIPTAELIEHRARTVLLDFPGFGKSPRPDDAWDTRDYARATRTLLADELGITRFIWVGHSFGGRVGLRLAQMPDSPVAHLVIVAGAGVKTPRPLPAQLRGKWRSWLYRRRKAQTNTDAELIALEKELGSADYVASRDTGLRDIFIKTVEEDQSDDLGAIACPTTLIYGARDTETPPAVGKMLHGLIPQSDYIECPEFDHISMLSRGRHQVVLTLRDALAKVAS